MATSSQQPIADVSRISETGFTVTMFIFLGLAVIFASSRTILRLVYLHKLNLDDFFLWLGVGCLAAATGTIQTGMNDMYLEITTTSNPALIGPDFVNDMLGLERYSTASSVLCWSCIYSIKFSFLVFFSNLISRVRKLEIWWYVVVAIAISCYASSVGLSFLMCTNFSDTFLQTCAFYVFVPRERTYLIATCCLDIFSDILIISIPILILYPVKISLRKKIQLSLALCLSAFMVIISIVRASTYLVPGTKFTVDTPWVFFWYVIEASVAIIVVSVTALKSIFGIASAAREQKRSKGDGYNNSSGNNRAKYYNMKEKDGSVPLTDISSYNDTHDTKPHMQTQTQPQRGPAVRPAQGKRVNSFAKYGVSDVMSETASLPENYPEIEDYHAHEYHPEHDREAAQQMGMRSANDSQIVVTREFTSKVEPARMKDRRVADWV